jgi:hypothetical protein
LRLPVIPSNAFTHAVYGLSRDRYIRSLGFKPFEWQTDILESQARRKIVNGARQSGKSTIIASTPSHRARYWPKSLSIVLAATERQAVEDIEKIKDFISRDPTYPEIMRDSDSLIELSNGSRILVVPATEKAARGYSNPDIIILDEASRIEDAVYKSGVRPMLTDNEKCELIAISTPNGRMGFFANAWASDRWERYEVRSPWEIGEDKWTLVETMPERRYRETMAKRGIKGYYSPRHHVFSEQQENLIEMGADMYRQEYLCEFVEPDEQTFTYDEVDAIMHPGEAIECMDFGLVMTDDRAMVI